MPVQERRLAAIMFTDIVGYTAMMEKNEDQAFEILRTNRKIHRELIRKYGGTWLKEIGDGILACFSSTTMAVLCAQHIQLLAKKKDVPLRIGIHIGDVIFEGGDVLGDGVNVASRIQDLAEKGCIAVSETVYKNIRNKTSIRSSFIREYQLKNVSEPIKIYQITTPEEGMPELRTSRPTPSFLKKKLLIPGILLLAVIITLAVYLVKDISFSGNGYPEPAIAVLPFVNQSDETEVYFSDGIMDAILSHLSRVRNLTVKSRLSVEKYRTEKKSAGEIAKELDVQYLINGSAWKHDNKLQVTVYLVDAIKDKQIWSERYEDDLDDVFGVIDKITRQIINEVNLKITAEEKSLISDYPETGITAWNYFTQARNYHYDYWLNDNTDALERAVILYNRTLEYDPEFAQAYTGLAMAYWDKNYWSAFFTDTFLDSVGYLTAKALDLNPQLEEAHFIKSKYFQVNGETDKAFEAIRRAIGINPNYVLAIRQLGLMYINESHDYVNGLKYLKKAASLEQGRLLPTILREIGNAYGDTGFPEEEHVYYWNALKLDSDSILYFNLLFYREKEPELALPYARKICQLDSSNLLCYECMASYNYKTDRFEEAAYYYFKYLESYKFSNEFNMSNRQRIAYTYWQMGIEDVAMNYFNEQIEFCLENIQKNRQYARQFGLACYDLAGIYCFLGDTAQTYVYLDKLLEQDFFPVWLIDLIRRDELFDGIRDEERFNQTIQHMENLFQKEHDRVKEWMEDDEKKTKKSSTT